MITCPAVRSAAPDQPELKASTGGLSLPRTAPQTEFNQFIPPQTQTESQLVPPTSPYTQYQYSSPALPTQAPDPIHPAIPLPATDSVPSGSFTLSDSANLPSCVATMSFTPQA